MNIRNELEICLEYADDLVLLSHF